MKQMVNLNMNWFMQTLLDRKDRMSMYSGLEVRVPFLDKNVMALAETLPLKYRVNPPRTKIALRAAADRVIQKKTAEKKKLGFPIPIRVWLREEAYYERVKTMFQTENAAEFFNLSYLMKLLEEHKAGKHDNSRKIWTVYIFLIWYERFFEE